MAHRIVFIAAIVFAVVALLHLARIFFPIPVAIGSLQVPENLSGVAFVVGGLLSAYLFRVARNFNAK